MSATTALFWRHGQTEYNRSGRRQGQVDIPLNDAGQAQAEAAAEILAQVRPGRIVSSDLLRARETAQKLADLTGGEVEYDERFRERSFGDWEGLTHGEISASWPEQFQVWESGGHPEGIGAETRRATGERVADGVRAVAAETEGVLVVVAHGAAISAGITSLLEQDPEVWRGVTGLGNCHWSLLRPNTGSVPPWRVAAHNVGLQDPDFTARRSIR